jgi:hypothetical protein
MDKRTAARRVRALRAKALAEGVTGPERASLNRKADELEQKYGKPEPPSVSIPEPTWQGREEYAEAVMRLFNAPIFKGPMPSESMDDVVEEGYLWAPYDDDDDDSY